MVCFFGMSGFRPVVRIYSKFSKTCRLLVNGPVGLERLPLSLQEQSFCGLEVKQLKNTC